MTKLSLCAGWVALSMASAAAGDALAAGTPVLVFDRQAVMNQSKLGQNIRQQITAYEQKMQKDLGPQGQTLQAQMQAGGGKPNPGLQAKVAAFRQKVQDQQSLIQGGEFAARNLYLAQENAILTAIMTERGAEAVVQKTAVAASAKGANIPDITKDVVARLDKKMTSYKVPLVKPPLSEQLQMMQQQPQQ